MKHIFWILSSTILFSFIQVDDKVNELSFIGKWKSFEGEIISVSFNESNEAYFRRNYNNQLQSEGTLAVDEKFILIERRDTTACLLYTSPSPRDAIPSRMPSSA